MANTVSNTTLNLSINGRQAAQVLDTLREKANKLREAADKAAAAGDKDKAARLEREYRRLNNIIRQSTSETATLEQTMRRLDKASPRELRKALSVLQRQLNGIGRGSEAWNRHVEMIRRVQAEITSLNQAMTVQQTLWERFNNWLNTFQTAIMAFVGAVTGIVAAGKSAVDKYADMEQEMAGVQKYSGLAADEVKRLNEEFKRIDTRSSREELNRMAQDAGRLGKTSVKEILGYVNAADKINVALDDLGKNATLTLSKLTGIFGDEERHGTEQSLLKVGSVINELSQNCSASAPYIANFTERLGGVGAQAGMTIQQIMGFAAVLDSNSQKVEASATALSQIIVRLYQDPAKYARVAGLEVKAFSDLMRRDANEALLLFLDTLNKAGGMDVLSPMFKDMGENGSRAIAALSTLANNIGAVKKQQSEANRAFAEGTSIQKEFDVQNNTVRAQMDKARKSIEEIAISLGEKLMPLMSHIYSSSSLILRALSAIVTFISDNFRTIVTLTAAIAAYSVTVNLATIRTKALAAAKAAWIAVTGRFTKALLLQDAAFALLHGDIRIARRALVQFFSAIKLNPIGLLVAGITAATVAFIRFKNKSDEFRKSMDEAEKSAQSFTVEMRKEQKEIDRLVGTLKAAKKGTKEYDDARKAIISGYAPYLQGIITEAGEISNLTLAYQRLTFAAEKSARARSNAKVQESIDYTYYSEVDRLTEKLRESLSKMGMKEYDTSRLVVSVSQGLASGRGIPEETFNEIRKYSEKNIGIMQNLFGDSPVDIMMRLRSNKSDYETRSEKLRENDVRYFRTMQDSELSGMIKSLSEQLKSSGKKGIEVSFSTAGEEMAGKIAEAITKSGDAPKFDLKAPLGPVKYAVASGVLSRDQAQSLLSELLFESAQRTPQSNSAKQSEGQYPESPEDGGKSQKSDPFRDALKALEAVRDKALDQAAIDQAIGNTDWLQYLEQKHESLVRFYDDAKSLYEQWKRTGDTGYSSILRQRAEEELSWKQQTSARSIEEVKRTQRMEEIELRMNYADKGKLSYEEESTLQQKLFDIRIRAMKKELSLTDEKSKEHAEKELAIEQALAEEKLRIRQELARKTAEIMAQYEEQSPAQLLKEELQVLEILRVRGEDNGGISQEQFDRYTHTAKDRRTKDLPGTRERPAVSQAQHLFEEQKKDLDEWLQEGLISFDEYSRRLREMKRQLRDTFAAEFKNAGSEWVSQLTSMYQAWSDFAEALKDPDGDPFKPLSDGIRSTAAVMTAVMQSVTQLTQAQVEIQTSAVERRYSRESAFAEGNAYLQQKLEKKKEKEIAKLKSEASKKNFAMQVAATVANTAANAVAAYGAALHIKGMAGLILAPIAAGLALAQGAVQIAVLKKQQQAAEATGYSGGGFTKKGKKDEPAGIVHAGEWVAPQSLVNNPRVRPVIDILEQARRTNVMPTLSMEDVSRSISAPMRIAYAPRPVTVTLPTESGQIASGRAAQGEAGLSQGERSAQGIQEILSRLSDRLDRPIIAHTSVAGPHGIRQAEDEYARLMANKSR